MWIVVLWAALSAVIAIVARRRGRGGFIWFLISFVISPLVAGVLVMVLPEGNDGEIGDGYKKRCPYCDEMIRAAANTCRYCGKDVAEPKTNTDANDAALAKLIERIEESKRA